MDKAEGLRVEFTGGLGCDSAGQPLCAEEPGRRSRGIPPKNLEGMLTLTRRLIRVLSPSNAQDHPHARTCEDQQSFPGGVPGGS